MVNTPMRITANQPVRGGVPIGHDEDVIVDFNVTGVRLGGNGTTVVIKSGPGGGGEVYTRQGSRMVAREPWQPILDAGVLPDGQCIYLTLDPAGRDTELKDGTGNVLHRFGMGSPFIPEELVVTRSGEILFPQKQGGWYQLVDRYGFPRISSTEKILAAHVPSRTEQWLVVRSAGYATPVLKDGMGRVRYEFDRNESISSVRVNGDQVTYVVKDRTMPEYFRVRSDRLRW